MQETVLPPGRTIVHHSTADRLLEISDQLRSGDDRPPPGVASGSERPAIVACPACGTRFLVDRGALGGAVGREVRCANCDHRWHYAPESTVVGTVVSVTEAMAAATSPADATPQPASAAATTAPSGAAAASEAKPGAARESAPASAGAAAHPAGGHRGALVALGLIVIATTAAFGAISARDKILSLWSSARPAYEQIRHLFDRGLAEQAGTERHAAMPAGASPGGAAISAPATAGSAVAAPAAEGGLASATSVPPPPAAPPAGESAVVPANLPPAAVPQSAVPPATPAPGRSSATAAVAGLAVKRPASAARPLRHHRRRPARYYRGWTYRWVNGQFLLVPYSPYGR